jgi:hypothetical protein
MESGNDHRNVAGTETNSTSTRPAAIPLNAAEQTFERMLAGYQNSESHGKGGF